ncbi:MAG: tetratricopeptide repeat protein, partial [Betaproteobacteria bacterium]|nr:tetratricopeptide repeat protein [Betaproteobacteria bacterium]
ALAGLALSLMPRGRTALAAALALVLALGTVLRNRDYRSEVALWTETVRQSPGKARAFNNLGFALQQAGRTEEARAAYERALALDPQHVPARVNLRELDRQ